jgi:hypothetical protein
VQKDWGIIFPIPLYLCHTAIEIMEKRLYKNILVFVGLVALIVVGRYLPHAANFTPAAAAGLFAAYYFRNRLTAVAVPLTGMLLSDMLLDMPYHLGTMAVVYAAIALPALVAGSWLRNASKHRWSHALKAFAGTVGASMLFFISTNFAVWAFDGLYAHNMTGFVACYAAAVPFLKWTLAGDLSFGLLLFGGAAALQHIVAARQKVQAA